MLLAGLVPAAGRGAVLEADEPGAKSTTVPEAASIVAVQFDLSNTPEVIGFEVHKPIS